MKPDNMTHLFLQTRFLSEAADLPDEFWLVTAHNPDGVDFPDDKNGVADLQLFQELDKYGQEPIRIIAQGQSRCRDSIRKKGLIDRVGTFPGQKGEIAAPVRLAEDRATAVLGCKAGAPLFGGFPCKPQPPVRFSWPCGGAAAHGRHCVPGPAFVLLSPFLPIRASG